MVKIELTETDADFLLETLQTTLDELKTERVRTDNRVFHTSLIERERFVTSLIDRLQSQISLSPA